ncbi:MAG: amidohydrolase family protein [Oscillospiraceae bacterium]|nr:amidohydrolase family protein [Oscillospiraceae bacterium]
MRSFIIKGTICYSLSPKELAVHPNGYAVCVDGVSMGVFAHIPGEYQHLPALDYGDHLVIPGLVDLHIHGPQYTFRGTGMDLELMDWLQKYAFPEESRFENPEYAAQAYEIFARQMKKSATTRAVVFGTRHATATEILMEKLEETGLVTYVGKVNMDQNAPEGLQEASAEASAEATVQWLEQTAERFERCKPILTPRFIPSCSRQLMEKLQEIRKAWNVPLQSHLSENPLEIQIVGEMFPQEPSYGHCYDRFGMMDEKTIMAHCVYSSPEEVQLIKQRGVFVAHCPASNTNIASGIAPIRRYLDGGLRVGLGSDVAGGQTESIFRAMTDAIQVSKLYWRLVDNSCKPLCFAESFYLATMGGGAFFGKVGSFLPGYAFDALVLDESAMPYWSPMDPVQRLERYAYLQTGGEGLLAKFVAGTKII